MNKLAVIKPGGLSYTQDDINWMQNGFLQALTNLLVLNGYNYYIISGCTPTTISGTIQGHTAGVVVFNGEICVIDADTVGIDTSVHPTTTWYYEKVTTYDPTGLKNFFSGGPKDMYQINKVQLVVDASPPSDAAPYQIPSYAQVLAEFIGAGGTVELDWTVGMSMGSGSISGNDLSLDGHGNTFQVNFTDGDLINVISGDWRLANLGTVAFVQFVGSNPGHRITIQGGGQMGTPNNRDYIYRSGDWAIFIHTAARVFSLIEKDTRGPWQNPSSFSASWTNASPNEFNYRINGDGMVSLQGELDKAAYTTFADVVFTLPAGFRPATNKIFNILTMQGVPAVVAINASSGAISVLIDGISSPSSVGVSFDGLSFFTD